MKSNINYKKWITLLDIILAVGLLLHSIILLTINNLFNPLDIIAEGTGNVPLERFFWRGAAENIVNGCSIIYCIGIIIMVQNYTFRRQYISFKNLLFCFMTQMLLMFCCTIFFAILDAYFFWDYITPIYWTSTFCVLIFVFCSIVHVYRVIKKRW